MGQNFIKFKFKAGESADKIRNLRSPDEILDHLAELKRALAKPRIQSELRLKIEINITSNLQSPIPRMLYKFPGIVKFRFRFQKIDGQYEDRNLDLQQFYEFYAKFEHFWFILGSQKIDPRSSKELMMSRESREMEETKIEVKKPEGIEQLGEIKKYTDIPETQSVFVGKKPVIQQPEPVMVTKKIDLGYRNSNPRNSDPKNLDPRNSGPKNSDPKNLDFKKSDGEEKAYCVLCFANPVEMLLPCYHGYCEQCCLDWYKVKGKNECPMCRAPITASDFDTNVFLVMSRGQEEEVNASIKQELMAYISSLCRTLRF